ncbi:MAG: type II secretion system protein [Chthoniobacteraceae bacterium]
MHARRILPASRGFTLIELLAVIGIIAVLVAIMLPVIGSMGNRAKTTACLSNLRQCGVLIRLYTGENNDTFPNATVNNQGYVTALSAYLPVIQAKSNKNVFVSPAAKLRTTTFGNTNFTYAVHNGLFGGSAAKQESAVMTTDVKRPSEVIMMANGAQLPEDGGSCAYTFYNPYELNQGLSSDVSTKLDQPIPCDDSTNVDNDNGEGYLRYVQNNNTAVNCLMVDGHVETIAKGKVLYRNVVYDQ